jgi:hypothetical protein
VLQFKRKFLCQRVNVLITDTDVGALQNKDDRVIIELESWFQRNDLIINAGTPVVMLFHTRWKKCPVRPQVTLKKMNLIYTAETKLLGVYIMETLKWNTHVQSLANKLNKVSFMIKLLKEIMSPCMKHNIYFPNSTRLHVWNIILEGGRRIIKKTLLTIHIRMKRSMIGVNSITSCKRLF